ncbi:MAG: hypothetical protein HYY93_14785 [Planctomycetes bacterium]|nr:hypothetical protein [Planctomycetota bacterium]
MRVGRWSVAPLGALILLVAGTGSNLQADDRPEWIQESEAATQDLDKLLEKPADNLEELARRQASIERALAQPEVKPGESWSWSLSLRLGWIQAARGLHAEAFKTLLSLVDRCTDPTWHEGNTWSLWKCAVRSGSPELIRKAREVALHKTPDSNLGKSLKRHGNSVPYIDLVGKRARRIFTKDIDGKLYNLETEKKKLVLVHFWGTW